MQTLWNAPADDPRACFLRWITHFFEALAVAHPASVANQIARSLRRDYRTVRHMPSLAKEFHLTTSQLRRAFQQEFGMSVHEYQRALRLQEALDQVLTMKVEALALHLGYKSKKNFYRAFHRLTGSTPTAFREQHMASDRHRKRSA